MAGFHLTNSNALSWIKSPFPGVSHKFLRIGDSESGSIDLTLIEKGAALPPHRHLVLQRAYFLSGRGQALDGTVLEAGSYAEVPAGARHGTMAIEETVILNVFEGIVSWLLDDGAVFLLKQDGTFDDLGKVAHLGGSGLT
jgi:quercetin dioxygenase-like cupin family protein